jgi:hypothetical protein
MDNDIEMTDDNSIDRAFARITTERNDEIEGNIALSYLYAVAWKNEFQSLLRELLGEESDETWESYSYYSQITNAAISYSESWSDSNKAEARFDGIAHFYKSLVYKTLAHFNRQGMNWEKWTDEDELYLYLDSVNYTEYIPNDFNNFALERINNDSIPMKIFANLPDNDIHIAFAPPFGVVLSIAGEKYFYPWSKGMLTPRSILPRLSLSDYDGDGADELAVILYVGSGTGYSVEELYIIEFNEHMTATAVTYETIKDLLSNRLSAYQLPTSFDPTVEEIIVKLDDQVVNGGYVYPSHRETEGDFQRLDLESLIWFYSDSNTLTVHIAIGLVRSAFVTPFEFIDFYADVMYNGSSISLSNCRLACRLAPSE